MGCNNPIIAGNNLWSINPIKVTPTAVTNKPTGINCGKGMKKNAADATIPTTPKAIIPKVIFISTPLLMVYGRLNVELQPSHFP